MSDCTCPDPWCQMHAQCLCGAHLIIDDPDSLAFCPECLMDRLPARVCATIFTIEDRDPSTCGRCGRPGGAYTEHPCLNDDGSSAYFREKYGSQQ